MFALLAIPLVIVVVGGILAWNYYRSQQLSDAYRRLAHIYGGHFQDAGWFNYPSARFPYSRGVCEVDMYSTGHRHKRYYTRVAAQFPDPTLVLSVTPEGFFESLGKMFGSQDITIGRPEFDNTFIIQSPHPPAAMRFLTPHVQGLIMALYHHYGASSVSVSIEHGRICVEKMAYIVEYESLLEMTQMTLALCESATPFGASGKSDALLPHAALSGAGAMSGPAAAAPFSFAGASPAPAVPAGPACSICHGPITEDAVHCATCHMPYHRPCWNQTGRCSTSGCSEVTYFRGLPQ